MSFVTEKTVKAVRKRHLCAACDKYIEVGEPAVNWSGTTDGDFSSCYYHVECRAAELAYNRRVSGTWFPDDEWWPLHEAEQEEYRWLKANHSVAYRRMLTPRERYDHIKVASRRRHQPENPT